MGQPVETALVAREAGSDILQIPRPDLFRQKGIGEQRPAISNNIARNSQGFACHIRIIHPTGQDDRHIDMLFQNFSELTVHSLFEIHGGMIPVPGVVGAGIHVEHVNTGIDQDLRGFDAFGDIFALFIKLLTGQGPLSQPLYETFQTVPERYGEIFATDGFNALHDIGGYFKTAF